MAELKALSENRKEHLQYLEDILVEPLIQEFQDIYQSVTPKSKILQEFQNEIGKIPEWNHVLISSAYERIKTRSGCNFLPDLIRTIFITSVKYQLMTHGRLDALDKVKLRVPTTEKFIHRVLISCAQILWKQPYLFYHAVRSIERQYNRVKTEELIRKQILATIRSCLPMDQILALVSANIPDETESEISEEESEESESESEESLNESEEEQEPESEIEVTHIQEEDEQQVDNEIKDEDEKDNHDDESESESEKEEDEIENVATIIEQESESECVSDLHIPEDLPPKTQDDHITHDPLEHVEEEHDQNLHLEIVATPSDHSDAENDEEDINRFNALVSSIPEISSIPISDAEDTQNVHTIDLSSSSESESDNESDNDGDTHPQQTSENVENRKVIAFDTLINKRKFHQPKMLKVKHKPRVQDAFF